MKFIMIFILSLTINLYADFSRNSVLKIVTDMQTRLQWQDNESVMDKKMNWREAIDYCSALSLDGGDWRLPNLNELYYLADRSKTKPAIDKIFKFKPSNNFWSSTTHPNDKNHAWGVYFLNGQANAEKKDKNFYVRCVRNGKSGKSESK